MIALLVLAVLSGPGAASRPEPRAVACGQIVCPLDRDTCVCAPRVISLGAFDPRPAAWEWPSNAYQSPPPDFGAYPTEKREP